MQIFFIVRQLWHTLTREIETELPLISGDEAISSNDTLDLSNDAVITIYNCFLTVHVFLVR